MDTSKVHEHETSTETILITSHFDVNTGYFSNTLTFYKFDTQTVAIDTARNWFPLLKELEDSDYFVEAYVVTPAGSIPYTNKVAAS